MASVGFIGLGNMGSHMARNLLRQGCKLVVCDVDANRIAELKSEGAEIAEHPADVAIACTKLMTMLPNSRIVTDVFTADNGILRGIQPKTMCIDSSTIDQKVAIDICEKVKSKDAYFLDAPVSGGVVGAQNATLTFMVGGDETLFNSAVELLKFMGTNIVHCGAKVGSGLATKICNNMLLSIQMIGVAEAMNLGIKMGLDAKKLASVINTSSGRCWSSDTYNPVPNVIDRVPSSNNYQGGFSCALIAKDLGIAENASSAYNASIPLGQMAHKIYDSLSQSSEFSKLDFGVIYQHIKNLSYQK